jgi:hypothetical protein
MRHAAGGDALVILERMTEDKKLDSGIERFEESAVAAEIGLPALSADFAVNGLLGKELQFLLLILEKIHSPRISVRTYPGQTRGGTLV